MSFAYKAKNKWLVYAGLPGSVSEIGKSTDNPPPGEFLSAGAELTSNDGRATGSVSDLGYLNSDQQEISGWGDAGVEDIGGLTTTKWVGSGSKEVSFATPC